MAVYRGLIWILLFGVISCAHRSKRSPGDDLRKARAESLARQAKSMKTSFDPDAPGAWPITAKYDCDTIQTRDTHESSNLKNAGKINSGPACGMNMFMSAKHKEKKLHKREKRSHLDDNNEMSEVMELLKEIELELDHDESLVGGGEFSRTKKTIGQIMEEPQERRAEEELDIVGGEEAVEPRIVGGEEVEETGKYPWTVCIGRKDSGLSCGGTLISDQWVLTAAHCFEERVMPCAFNIRIGTSDWLVDNTGHHVDREPAAIYRHPDFDFTTLTNDVALVKLSEPVELDPDGYINSICLPSQGEKVHVDDVCVAAGWGAMYEGACDIPRITREVNLPVLPEDECNFPITEKQLCAGTLEGGKDTCQGDSGGPLMFQKKGRWQLAGITSYGKGCARAEWPGIYTDVSSYVDYINSVVNRYS